jgi:hypothetical protein
VINGLIKENDIYDSLRSYMMIREGTKEIYLTVLFLMEAMSVLSTFAIGQLIIFHTYLGVKKITTYEYILKKRKNEEKYKVAEVQKKEKPGEEEVPLEEVYEPYMENPQYKQDETQNESYIKRDPRVVPSEFITEQLGVKE